MKRIIICITLFVIATLIAIPAMASAQVTPRTKTIDCGTTLKLGNSDRRTKVSVYTGKRMVFKRTMRVNKQFGKHLDCGKRYRAVYNASSGDKVTRKFEISSDEDSEYYADDEEAGTDLSPEEQLEEDRIWAEMEAEEQAEEACEVINAPHEDDDEWDSFACMDAFYASIGETWDDQSDDPDDSDEGDE